MEHSFKFSKALCFISLDIDCVSFPYGVKQMKSSYIIICLLWEKSMVISLLWIFLQGILHSLDLSDTELLK